LTSKILLMSPSGQYTFNVVSRQSVSIKQTKGKNTP
jgi:hypothetical protein